MAAAPLIIGGVSSVVGVAGAQQQAAAQQAASNYNAAIKQQQANSVIAEASEDARRLKIQGNQALGGIKAATGASGIQMDASALDVLETSAANSELDAQTIKHQGQLKAWAYQSGAKLDLLEGENSKIAGQYGAAGYLLKGLSSMSGSFGGGGSSGGSGGSKLNAGSSYKSSSGVA